VNAVARFESFIERVMERMFSRATGSTLQPIEIGKRLTRAMESEQSVGVEGILVPNVYEVFLGPQDYEHFGPARRAHARDLETHLARVARQRRYHMVARPVVRIGVDERLDPGDVRVEPQTADVDTGTRERLQHTAILPSLSGPLDTGPVTPNLVLNGKSYAILSSPTRVGRQADNDIVLDDRRVSRHHAEVIDRGGRWVIRDRDSTNGTAVNGKVTKEAVLKPGDRISFGGLEVTWEQ
jgi:hypothetical protein